MQLQFSCTSRPGRELLRIYNSKQCLAAGRCLRRRPSETRARLHQHDELLQAELAVAVEVRDAQHPPPELVLQILQRRRLDREDDAPHRVA